MSVAQQDDEHVSSTQFPTASGEDPFHSFDSSSSSLDPSSRGVQLFVHYQQQALLDCSRRLAEQETVLQQYNHLITRLATLPDQPRYPAVIPLGTHAVVRGELVHTNEILVFLGDNYFVERSSKQASEIASRRIATVQGNIAKLTEERNLIQSKMDMLSSMIQQQSLSDVVEIREKLDDESDEPGGSHEKPDVELLKRLDQLHDEEERLTEELSPRSSIEVDEVEFDDLPAPRRPIPPPTARPRRSSLPCLTGEGVRKKERKSVSFAPFQGSVPERESKDHPMFKQALQMMLASGKFKTMDEGSLDLDEMGMPTGNYRTMSADSALPRLKKQAHIIMESMDVDVDEHIPAAVDESSSDVIPMMDGDEIVERNIDAAVTTESPALAPPTPDIASTKPVSRFKASRQK